MSDAASMTSHPAVRKLTCPDWRAYRMAKSKLHRTQDMIALPLSIQDLTAHKEPLKLGFPYVKIM